MPTWADVVAIGTRLPEVEVTTSYGTPALKVNGKGMVRLRTEPDALVVHVTDMEEREALLRGRPDECFTIPHYDGHPYVLVRLDRVDPGLLTELVEDSWRLRAPKRALRAHHG